MSTKKIVLKSSDGESFEVDEAVALQSQTVAHLIEDDCAENGVPLANVTSKVLSSVIEYCKKHVGGESWSDEKKEEIKNWDASFIARFNEQALFELILAANYLNIKDLLDLTCKEVADVIKDKTVEDVRATFGIENDFSPEEEAKLREENKWAFE